ncbi:MAG: response regulator [Nitrospinae bacterium]|nr:response regulator [Nitrospinota bacterium]
MAETILVVDDEKREAEMMALFLKKKGFVVYVAYSGIAALVNVKQYRPEVVVMDIKMPGMSGSECLPQIKNNFQTTEVVMATAVGDTETAIGCMKAGAFGYLLKPINLEALYDEIGRALEHRALVIKVEDYQKNLEKMVGERTAEITQLNQRLKENFLTSVRMLISLLETYDAYIGSHLRRVAQLAGEMARGMKLPPKDVSAIELAGLLHDVGTVALPPRLRTANFSELTPDEITTVKQHPVLAQSIMENSEELALSAQFVRRHLEHLDGTGFPDGIKDAQIPVGARILAVANTYDELVFRRRFTNEALATEADKTSFAVSRIEKLAGKSLDGTLTGFLTDAVERIRLRAINATVVGIDSLKPGMKLAEDVKTAEGLLLLSKGFQISSKHVDELRRYLERRLIGGKFYVQK